MDGATINLNPDQFLAGWREDARMMFLPALSERRVGDQVAVRIGLLGRTVRSTIFGRVAMVRRYGRASMPPGVDLEVSPGSYPAIQFLASAARGEPVTYRERAPRFVVDRPLLVNVDGATVGVRTATVSEGGCALRWPAPQAPSSGDTLAIRLGGGLFAATATGVVCWSDSRHPGEQVVGVRIQPDGRGARGWKAMVDEAARSGAPAA